MVELIVFGIVVFVCLCALGMLCLYKWGCFPEFHGRGQQRNGGSVPDMPDMKMQPLDMKLLQKKLKKLEVERMLQEGQEKEKVGMKALEHTGEHWEVGNLPDLDAIRPLVSMEKYNQRLLDAQAFMKRHDQNKALGYV